MSACTAAHCERVKWRAAKRPSAARQYRHVMVQVLLEEGVVGRHAGHARAARAAHAGVVGQERRVDMHQVEFLRRQRIECPRERAPAHAPVLGILGHRGGGDTQHVALGGRLGRVCVARRDQPRLDALGVQIVAEGADGGGDAVDAREVDIGDEQDPHARASATHGAVRAMVCAWHASERHAQARPARPRALHRPARRRGSAGRGRRARRRSGRRAAPAPAAARGSARRTAR